eukprot:1157245-Pelagomonas_calceolata.AAC.3
MSCTTKAQGGSGENVSQSHSEKEAEWKPAGVNAWQDGVSCSIAATHGKFKFTSREYIIFTSWQHCVSCSLVAPQGNTAPHAH